jgi:hypothetical protein
VGKEDERHCSAVYRQWRLCQTKEGDDWRSAFTGQLRPSGPVVGGHGKMKNGVEAGLGCHRKQAKIKRAAE